MAQWLGRATQGHEVAVYDPEVMVLYTSRVQLWVCSPSIQAGRTNIIMFTPAQETWVRYAGLTHRQCGFMP